MSAQDHERIAREERDAARVALRIASGYETLAFNAYMQAMDKVIDASKAEQLAFHKWVAASRNAEKVE